MRRANTPLTTLSSAMHAERAFQGAPCSLQTRTRPSIDQLDEALTKFRRGRVEAKWATGAAEIAELRCTRERSARRRRTNAGANV